MGMPFRVFFTMLWAGGALLGILVLGLLLVRKARNKLTQESECPEERPPFTVAELCRMRELRKTTEEEFDRIKKRALSEIELTAPGEGLEEFLNELKVAFKKGVINKEEYRRLQRKALESIG